MFDWIPIDIYVRTYHQVIGAMVFVVLLESLGSKYKTGNKFRILGFITLVFIILYMGSRPISGRYFGDMRTYANYFQSYADGTPITSTVDILFHLFTKIASKIMTVEAYFMACAFIYVVPLYLVCKKWFGLYWFYGFLFVVGAFSFWTYGTNGIRNGIAGSLFLLGVSREKRLWQIVWIIAAVNFHKSMILPTGGFILANFYNRPQRVVLIWILCIPFSLVAGGFFEGFFAGLGFEDDRLAYLTEENIHGDEFAYTGFRWDFLMYSATAVFAGWYYIIKKGYRDKVYFWLFNTYIFANAFWVLIIRANFSNRFAYLSWFMIGLVIIYPLLRVKLLEKQFEKIGLILLFYYSFTYVMNVILAK